MSQLVQIDIADTIANFPTPLLNWMAEMRMRLFLERKKVKPLSWETSAVKPKALCILKTCVKKLIVETV